MVLDIGSVIGSNIEFFLNLGVKIYMEDLLPAYLNPLYTKLIDDKLTLDEQKFFSENLQYEDTFFDGLICWDIMNYVDPKFAKIFAALLLVKSHHLTCHSFFKKSALTREGTISDERSVQHHGFLKKRRHLTVLMA